MSGTFLIDNGEASLTKDGLKVWSTAYDHMTALGPVVGVVEEPQRNGAAYSKLLQNVDVDETVTLGTCNPKATHLMGSLVMTLGAGSDYSPAIPAGKHYTYMGGTFIYAHNMQWFAGYTFFVENGLVKYHRRVVSAYENTSVGKSLFFNIRAFSLAYNFRAIRFT